MHLALLKYSVMRLAIFVISLILLYAVGVRQSLALLVLAVAISLALSYLLLRKQRDAVTVALMERTSRRLDSKQHGFGASDAEAEDEAVDQAERSERQTDA